MRSIILAFTALLVIGGAAASQAQSTELVLGPDSKLWIDGTSNKSDWTVTATEMAGTLRLDGDGFPSQVTVTVAADKIESSISKIMDRLMYRALKTKAHPTITYTLASTEKTQGTDSLATTGQVSVAGVTRDAQMVVQWISEEGATVRVRGTHPMKMTDHGMKPPTAMFGALHTGNEVVVHFDVLFAPATTTASGS